jgi:hypothetical protein
MRNILICVQKKDECKNRRCVESIKKYNINDNRIKDIYSELSENNCFSTIFPCA